MAAGPIVPNVPASVLQLHNDVTVVADAAALSILLEKGLLRLAKRLGRRYNAAV